jgi:hypothetical protein
MKEKLFKLNEREQEVIRLALYVLNSLNDKEFDRLIGDCITDNKIDIGGNPIYLGPNFPLDVIQTDRRFGWICRGIEE